ncbi:MAG TPA: hypothetical protein ENH85_00750 [Candidatus Scalindua sp.]|nr:hypothetical protein [Candidatus Scalindua sp.]
MANDPGDTIKSYGGGSKVIYVWATEGTTFNATVTIESSPDGAVTWIPATTDGVPAEFTENTIAKLDRLGQGSQVRAVITNYSSGTINTTLFD